MSANELGQVLGERSEPYHIAYTAVAADDTAGSKAFTTPFKKIDNWILQVSRSNADVHEDAAVTTSGGTITVADGAATYVITAGDIIRLFVWGEGGY